MASSTASFMHTSSSRIFERSLGGLLGCIDKGAAYAGERKFDPDVFVSMRIAPDMLPFSSQIQIACDTAKLAVARLTGVEAPKFEDSEKTLAELRARIVRTLDFVRSVPAERFENADTRDVELPRRGAEPRRFKGLDYLQSFALPNFFFHVTAAYALMRHGGVPLGKADYLNLPPVA